MPDVVVSRSIPASATALWALVSDLPRMGEWSPENVGGSWQKGATGPSVGARFTGNNKNGSKSWSTTVTITECDPGKQFGFRVTVGPIKVARWHYLFADNGDGTTTVTESWTEQRPGFAKFLGGKASGISDRAGFNRTSMETTLRNLEAATSR